MKTISTIVSLMLTLWMLKVAVAATSYDAENAAAQREMIQQWESDARSNNPGFDGLPKEQQQKLIEKEGLAEMERSRADIEEYKRVMDAYGTPQEKEEARQAIANLEHMQNEIRAGRFVSESDPRFQALDAQMRKDFEEEKKATAAAKQPQTAVQDDRSAQRAALEKEISDLKQKQANDPMRKAGYMTPTEHDDKLFAAQERLAQLDATPQAGAAPVVDTKQVQGAPDKPATVSPVDAEKTLAQPAATPRAGVQDKPATSTAVPTMDEQKPAAQPAVTPKKTSLSGVDWDKLDKEDAAAKATPTKPLSAADEWNKLSPEERATRTAAFNQQIADLKEQKDAETTKKPGYFRRVIDARKDAAQQKSDAQKTALDNEIKSLTEQRDKAIADRGGMQAPTEFDDKLRAAQDKRAALDAPKGPGVLQRTTATIRQKVAQFQLMREKAKAASIQKDADKLKNQDAGSRSYYSSKMRESEARQNALRQKMGQAPKPVTGLRPLPTQRPGAMPVTHR